MAPEPWSASDLTSFAHETVTQRWPAILQGVVRDLETLDNSETSALIGQVQQLSANIVAFKELEDLPDNAGPNAAAYNAELRELRAAGQSSWLTSSWLFGECYLYAKLHSLLAATQSLQQYDPFRSQKRSSFESSNAAVVQLVEVLQSFHTTPSQNYQKRFFELCMACLWGNATDLSLFTNLTEADIVALQSGNATDKVGRILVNDLEAAYRHIAALKGGRLDIVLDNAGFEVFTDFVFADWLLQTPFINEVVFHPKTLPWFVSDVVNQIDVEDMFDRLEALASEVPQRDQMHAVVQRWKGHLSDERFRFTTPASARIGDKVPLANFWTSPFDFRSLPTRDGALLKELQRSDLVLFKGDLNYRRLVGDLRWAPETPFTEALGDLNGQFNLLSLRTCKADVVVGLHEGQAAGLDQQDPRWRVNGKYAVVCFASKSVP